MQRDPEEVFRFIWENRETLGLVDGAFTRVLSIRPCLRVGDDEFLLRETVAEYVQILKLEARELRWAHVRKPEGMPSEQEVSLYGGGVLIFDEYGQVKFHIHNRLDDSERQSSRLQHLFDYGHFNSGSAAQRRFSRLHRMRAINTPRKPQERWI